MKFRTYQKISEKSCGLVLVMWATAFLSMIILGLFSSVLRDLEISINEEADFRARQIAESGIALASHPRIRPGDPLLNQQLNENESFEVVITDEASRLNVNFLLFSGRTDVLENLLRIWGLRTNEINAIIDCLYDWYDDNDLRRLNGAESAYYESIGMPGLPTNGPFMNLDELEFVKNWNLVIRAKPNWREYFTLFGSGKINVNEANTEILQAVFNCTEEQAKMIVNFRNGTDATRYTEDDNEVRDLNQLYYVAGLSRSQIENNQSILRSDGELRRVESRAKVGNYTRKIEVILNTTGSFPKYLDWREP